jgi:hypothetical protein
MTTSHHTAAADQRVAQLVAARCCDAFDPCDTCRVGRVEVTVRRHLTWVEQVEIAHSPAGVVSVV